jgi:hypothetical protein
METLGIVDPALAPWTQLTADAFAALADALPARAADLWLRAADPILRHSASDPLRAAAHSNAGVASLLRSSPREAAAHFTMAQRLWDQSRTQLEHLDMPIAGRSSVFHLRLAMQHQDRFADLQRRRHLASCAAARAITKFNAQQAGTVVGRDPHAIDDDQNLIGVLSSAFGPNCVEVRLLRHGADRPDAPPSSDALAAYRDKAHLLAKRNARARIFAEPFCDDLDRAAQHTALLHRGLAGMQSFSDAHQEPDNEK